MPRRSVRTRKRETGSNSTSKGSGKTTAKNNPIVDAPANDNGVSSRLRPRPPVPPKGNKSPPNSKGKTNNNKNVNGNKKIRPHPKVKSVALDPSVYVSPSGEEYRPGDFAYVDSQHPDQSYHVCLIKDFKQTRRDSMIAEIVWFFRVQEIPESTYLLLLEDRKSSKWQDVFANNKVKQRELFIAHNVDTHHTSFFRGKCDVKRLEEVDDLHQLISSKDSFFYDLGYSPESRQLTWLNEGNDAYIPYSHQAVVPEVEDVMEYPQREDDYQDKADPVWSPEHSLNDQDLLMYLRSARSVALHAGLWINGYLREGYLAASSDDTTQNAYDVLKDKNFDIREALQDLVKHPNMAKALIQEKCWCADDTTSFTRGVKQFGKNFHKIQQEYFPTRHVSELTQYYYHWKKTTVGLSSRAHRRQNKMRHIRLWKQMGKIPPCQQQEREMIDLSSCEEDDEEEYRDFRLYACKHCYSKESSSWHHAGPNRLLVCHTCQLFFFKYGEMPPITERGSPPQVLFKDYHKALHLENLEGRRTTRNNGGAQDTKDGASEKVYKSSESGSGEEESASDSESSDDSSVYAGTEPVSKLQRRKSILTSLPPEGSEEEDGRLPPTKKIRSDVFKEEVKTEDPSEEPLSLQPPCKGAPILSAVGNTVGASSRVDGRKIGDSLQDDELQCLEPPPNFLRVGEWSSNGETAARTHFKYVHNENAKYIQQKKVTLRTDKEGGQSTPSVRTPSTAQRVDQSSHSSSFTFPPVSGHTQSSMLPYSTSSLYSQDGYRQSETGRWGDSLRYQMGGYPHAHQLMSSSRSSSGSGKTPSQSSQRAVGIRGVDNALTPQTVPSMMRPQFDPSMAEMTQANSELMQRPLMILPNNAMDYFPVHPAVNSPMIGSFPGYAIMGGIPAVAPEQHYQYSMYHQMMAQQQQQQQQQQQMVVQLAQQPGQEPTPIHKPVIVHST